MDWFLIALVVTVTGSVSTLARNANPVNSEFTCPEEFGYFPHHEDCSQYYVCVFGNALLESCTGGLMYSHVISSCDWPKNVACGNTTSTFGESAGSININQNNNVRLVDSGSTSNSARYQQQPQQQQQQRQIVSNSDLRDDRDYLGQRQSDYISVREEQIVEQRDLESTKILNSVPTGATGGIQSTSPKYLRFQDDNQADGSRLGRSYEQNVPNYKDELYAVGRHIDDPLFGGGEEGEDGLQHLRRKRQANGRRHGPHPGVDNMYPSSHWTTSNAGTNRQREVTPRDLNWADLSYANHHRLYRPVVPPSRLQGQQGPPFNLLQQQQPQQLISIIPHGHQQQLHHSQLQQLQQQQQQELQREPETHPHPHPHQNIGFHRDVVVAPHPHQHPHRLSIPRAPSVRPTNNPLNSHSHTFQRQRQRHHQNLLHPPQSQHEHEEERERERDRHRVRERQRVREQDQDRDRDASGSDELLRDSGEEIIDDEGGEELDEQHRPNSDEEHENSSQINDNDNHSNHNYNNNNDNNNNDSPNSFNGNVQLLDGFQPSTHPMWTTHSPMTRDEEQSVNGGGKSAVTQQQEIIVDPEYLSQRYAANANAAPVNTTAGNLYYDDSYYVYDDEKEAQYDDVDYKTNQQQQQSPVSQVQQQQQVVVVQTTTRRPVPVTEPPTPATRRPVTSAPVKTSRGSARHKSNSGNRPTLKPSSTIVKDVVQDVRDVYADPPSRPPPVYETVVPNTPATKCRKDECVLPDCNCGGKDIPGGLSSNQVPQIVLLTFDDSVNDLNKDLYRDLFEKGRKNPNGCPISATFYVSHEWTDYSQVQNLAADGHEIASHSVSHSFGEQFSQKKWEKEIGGQREILAAYGGVKLSEIRGMRAPFLAVGGNNMFKMLHDSNFTYDSSMPVYENKPPSWPYTLDHRIFHDCMIPPCPTKAYPGVWEVPMVMWQDLKGGRCSMGDACSNPPTAEGVYNMLAKNFERHYTTNRAPFGLYYHAAWFTQPHHKEGFEAFLDTLVNMDDVWLVTNWQAIQWVRDPTPINRILNFEPFSCHNKKDRPRRCNHPKVCNLWHKSGVRYMKTCQACPQQYPWVSQTGIPKSPNSL